MGDRCAFRDTAIRVTVYTVFLNKVNTVPTSMLHVLSFFFWYTSCLFSVQCGCYETAIELSWKAQQFPPNFNAPDDSRIDRNIQCNDEF
jgi:hypothetical protein